MLAKPGSLPTGRSWSFEPKWDGFRAIVRSGEDYCVRSRRGWHMTDLLPEFAGMPVEGVFDGELVAFGDDGLPSFDRLSRRILHGETSIPVTLVVFDVLEVEGLSTMREPYRERRAILELLDFGFGCYVCPPSRTVRRCGSPSLNGALRESWRRSWASLAGPGSAAGLNEGIRAGHATKPSAKP
jgi:bifunctional non-homologous end joining protein LigD